MRLALPALLTTTALASLIAPVAAQAQSADDPTALEEIVVTGQTTAATKTRTALVDIPSSVTLIDARRLEDRRPLTLNEALGYAPGVNVGAYGYDTRYDAFFIRGFPATYTGVFRDGLRQLNSPSGLYRNEPYGIESLSLLRGPASVLYGASGAGGLVDIRSKRPTAEDFTEVEAQVGSHDRYQLNFDTSRTLSDTLAARLTAVARDSETSLSGFPDDRLFIAPALTWRPDARTSLTVLGDYMTSRTGGSAAFYNDANGITAIQLSDPRFNDFDHEQWRLGYEVEHRFDGGLLLHQNLRYHEIDVDLEYAYVIDPTPPVTRASGMVADDVRSFGVDNQARYELDAGGARHRLLAGVDYNHVRYRSAEGYGAVPPTGEVPTPDLFETGRQTFRQTGVYVQDQIEAGRLGIVAGLRYDWLDADTLRYGAAIAQDDEALTGRVGATWAFDGGITPYANWSSSFEPNVGLLVDGPPAAPTRAEQVEAGVKYQLPGRRVLLTAAVFDIRQEDGVVFDASSGVNQQVQLDLRSRGVELEASARLADGLDLTAAYAYTDMEIERGAQGTDGNTLSATPKHSGSVWIDWASPVEGLGLGGGLRYFGESFGNDQNTIENGERLFADAVIHYDLPSIEGVRLQLNAKNLFDKRDVTCASGYCYRDEGRNLVATVSYRF